MDDRSRKDPEPPQNGILVLCSETGPREIVLHHVPAEEWGFSLIDRTSCQLNATNHPGPPAELHATIDFAGETLFEADVMVENPLGHGVTFGLTIDDAAAGRVIGGASMTVAAGERTRMIVRTGELRGRCNVILWTRMAPGSPTNHQVRSYWLTPEFHRDAGRGETGGHDHAVLDVQASAPPAADPADTAWEQVSRELGRGAGPAGRIRVPVRWSQAHRDSLARLARGETVPRAEVDPPLAFTLLQCADGDFDRAEAAIADLLRANITICRQDKETFISFVNALFTVQRFDLVAALLRAQYGYGRGLELGVGSGPGTGRIRWDIAPAGQHRFIFDEKTFQSDNSRTTIVQFQWAFPMFAAYSQRESQETGSVFINQTDVGLTPGLAYCDWRPDYFLIPDYIFVPTEGYSYAREILREKRIAWHDRIPVAFWRGATTGVPRAPNDWRSLERIALCELARRHAESGWIDAGISSIAQFGDPTVVREIQESGLMRDPVPWQDWGRYKYHIDIDGNSSPWSNLFQKLLTGSPVLKVVSSCGMRQWYYDDLIPWVNYVPVSPDMSDLMDRIAWLRNNDEEARRIGEAGLALAGRLSYKAEIERSASTISAAFRYFNPPSGGGDRDRAPDVPEAEVPPSTPTREALFDAVAAGNGGVVVDGRHGYYHASYEAGGASLAIFSVEKTVTVANINGGAVLSWPATTFDTGQPTARDIGLPCHVPGAGAGGGDFVSPIVGMSNDFHTVTVILRDPAQVLFSGRETKLTWPCFLSPAWREGNPAWTEADHRGGDAGKGIRISEGQSWRGGAGFAFPIRNHQCPVMGTISDVAAPDRVRLSIAYGSFGFSIAALPGVEVDWGTENSNRLLAAARACVNAGYTDLYFPGPTNGIVFATGCFTAVSPNSPESFSELNGAHNDPRQAPVPTGLLDTDSQHLWQNTRWIGDGIRSRIFSFGGAEIYKQIVPRDGPRRPPPRRMILGSKHLKRLNALIQDGAPSATVVTVSASIFTNYPTASGQPLQSDAIGVIRSWLQGSNAEITLNFVDRGIGGAPLTWMDGVADGHYPYWYTDRALPWWTYCDPVQVNGETAHGDLFLLFGDGSNDIWQISAASMLSLRRRLVAAAVKNGDRPPDILMANCRSKSHIVANNGQWVSQAAGQEFASTLLETLAENLNIGFYDLFHPSMLSHDGWSPRHMTSRRVMPPPRMSSVTPNRPYDCRYQDVRDYSGWFTIGAANGAAAWIAGEASAGRIHFTLSPKPDNQFIVGTDFATGNLTVMATTFGRWMTDCLTLDPETGVLTAHGMGSRTVSDITWSMYDGGTLFHAGDDRVFAAPDTGSAMLVSNGGHGGIPWVTQIVDVLEHGYVELSERLTARRSLRSGTTLRIGGALFCPKDADAGLDVVVFQDNKVHQGKITGYESPTQARTSLAGVTLSDSPATMFAGHLSVPWTVTGLNVSNDPCPDPALIFSKRYNRVSLAYSTGPNGGVAANQPRPVWSGKMAMYGGGFCPKVFVTNPGPCDISASAFAIDQKLLFSTDLTDLSFWGTGDGHDTEGGLGVHPTATQLAVLDELVASCQDWSAA